jgi:hypothetical protein
MRVDLDGPVSSGTVSYWTGGIEAPRRRLWDPCRTPIQAIRAVEHAEQQGPLSDDWANEPGVPYIGDFEFNGWQHVVKDGCHEWRRQGSAGQVLVVQQLPPTRFSPHLQFVICCNAACVGENGAFFVFSNPQDAIREAEKRFVLPTSDVLSAISIVTEQV